MRVRPLLPLLLSPWLLAQGKPTEEEVIAQSRKAAKPRAIAPRGALFPAELNLVKLFKTAKGSVVHVNALVEGFDRKTGQSELVPAGLGTGFVWDDQGHVVTNNHVVTVRLRQNPEEEIATTADEVRVSLADGKTYKARIIGRSLASDIAVLQVFAPLDQLRPLPLGRSGELQVGQSVLAIGNPFGLDQSLTTGIVSALDRTIGTDYGSSIKGAIQTDAAINPGNSGGPLLDTAGRLVGMNTAITSTSGSSAGIGFAIPVDTLNRIVPLLIRKGAEALPVLGFQTMSTELARRYYGVPKGIVVDAVEPGGPADKGGLKGTLLNAFGQVAELGDVIVGYNGSPVDTEVELADLLAFHPAGQPVVFDILRKGQPLKITIIPASRTSPKPVI
ncbi:MAG TPA: trypsin-like peptidase domain-containing protein [Holophagaceae bacterium]|nr:trypsin-like peptidase domain-containing protein [Holophagaceae bacterium]